MAKRVIINLTAIAPTRSVPTDTGRVGVALITEKGVFDAKKPVRSLQDFVTRYGARQSYSVAYDWMDLFFREGGHEAFVLPARGPAAAKATAAVAASTSGTAFTINASSVGEWGNSLSYQIIVGPSGGNNRQIVILLDGVEVDRSSEFTANTDAPTALANSDYVDPPVLGAGTGLVAAGSVTALAGGTLDRTNITQTEVDAALDLLVSDLGPMQLAAPDWQTSQCHTSLRARANTANRFALPDAPDGSSKSSLSTLGQAGQADANGLDSYAVLQPWLSIAGISGGAARSVPPSAFVAAKIAQTDPSAGPIQAPAGEYGQATSGLVLGVKQTWSDQDQLDLEADGVATIISENGVVSLDTDCTGVDPDGADAEWLQAGVSRYRMSLVARLGAAASPFRHTAITRAKIAQLDTALTGILLSDETNGQLFLNDGETAGQSFAVDTSDTVNTTQTIQSGQINAAVAFRPAPGADFINIDLTMVGVADQVAA